MYQPETREATSSATDHYPVLSYEELQKLDVGEIAEPDALLFMWTSSPHLDQAITLGKAWGFVYCTVAFVWDKQKVNPGNYTMSQCELCLVFKKGKIPKPRGARNVKQFLSEMRGRHSAKPKEIRDRIAAMFPEQKKIELFARERVNGWDAWGNEVE
jgi:N6-adenosine-specific RNA methylase IME4